MWDVVLFCFYLLGIGLDIIVFLAFLALPFLVAFLTAGLGMLAAVCCDWPVDVMQYLVDGWVAATSWYANLWRPSEPVFGDWGIDCLLHVSKIQRPPGSSIIDDDATAPLLSQPQQQHQSHHDASHMEEGLEDEGPRHIYDD
jgi:hypothetical protein